MTESRSKDGFVGVHASVLATKAAPTESIYYRNIQKAAYIIIQAGEGTDWLYENTTENGNTVWKASNSSGKICNVNVNTNTIVKN
jgi:hypothetical protein